VLRRHHVAEVVVDQRARLEGELAVAIAMVLVEVTTQQLLLAELQERRELRQIHAAHLEQHLATGHLALVQLAVARHVLVGDARRRIGVLVRVDALVRPGAHHVRVEHVGGPRAAVTGRTLHRHLVSIGRAVTRVGHGHVAEQQHGAQRRVALPHLHDARLHRAGRVATGHREALHQPAITDQILHEARQLGGELGLVGAVDDEQQLAPRVAQRRVEGHGDAPGGAPGRLRVTSQNAIFHERSGRGAGVDEGRRVALQLGQGRAPGRVGRLAELTPVHRDEGRRHTGRPKRERHAALSSVHLGGHLHREIARLRAPSRAVPQRLGELPRGELHEARGAHVLAARDELAHRDERPTTHQRASSETTRSAPYTLVSASTSATAVTETARLRSPS
jgi:hypothetical protein